MLQMNRIWYLLLCLFLTQCSLPGGGSAGNGPPVDPEAIRAAVNHPDRPAADRGRDPDRRPAEVLAFFGIGAGMHVGETMAAGGYYTEILARLVGPGGKVYAQNTQWFFDNMVGGDLLGRLRRPGLENVVSLKTEFENPGFPDRLDAVLLIRFYHDFIWLETDRAAYLQSVYRALKPGGIFGVVDHRAEPGSRGRFAKKLHRIDAEMVREEILTAGFLFEAESMVLHHPEDTLDWSIFFEFNSKRDRTDRFVFRFRKPAR